MIIHEFSSRLCYARRQDEEKPIATRTLLYDQLRINILKESMIVRWFNHQQYCLKLIRSRPEQHGFEVQKLQILSSLLAPFNVEWALSSVKMLHRFQRWCRRFNVLNNLCGPVVTPLAAGAKDVEFNSSHPSSMHTHRFGSRPFSCCGLGHWRQLGS